MHPRRRSHFSLQQPTCPARHTSSSSFPRRKSRYSEACLDSGPFSPDALPPWPEERVPLMTCRRDALRQRVYGVILARHNLCDIFRRVKRNKVKKCCFSCFLCTYIILSPSWHSILRSRDQCIHLKHNSACRVRLRTRNLQITLVLRRSCSAWAEVSYHARDVKKRGLGNSRVT